MCFKSHLTLLGLISLVALTGAKLRWKCELFDTSQETSTKTTFVEYVKGENPDPSVPSNTSPKNPRSPRSTPKCRPRPRNGTIGETTETEKMIIEKKKKFRPAQLKGADELDKPLTEHLDENVMPDFEFDEEDVPPVQEDLPWCPEVTEEDCETADLEKMSTQELVELKENCERIVTPERMQLIEKWIKIEGNPPEIGPPDRIESLPPTGTTNCSTSPSELSAATLEKYRKECPCEDDTSKMNEEEFQTFKEECLDPIEEPGKPSHFIRKNGRCGISQKKTNEMSEKEYELFVKECFVNPKNINLEKILIVNERPECKGIDRNGLSKNEFSNYRKECLTSKTCADIDESKLNGEEKDRFKKMCSPVIRKTKNLCDEVRVEELDNEQFEKYKRECILKTENDCDSIDVKSLSDSEYERYRSKCLESPNRLSPPLDCSRTDTDSLSEEELIEYNQKCRETRPPIDCKTIIPDELNDVEYGRYERECLRVEVNCSTADSREMTDKQYERFEKACLKKKSDCRNVKIKELNEEDYELFRRNCIKIQPKIDCSNVKIEELTDEEYGEYKRKCMNRRDYFDCNVKQSELIGEKLTRFRRECVKENPDCSDVRIEELNDDEYRKFSKKCLKETPEFDCSSVNAADLQGEELAKYRRECLDEEEFDCNTIEPKSLSKRKQKMFMRKCVKNTENCRNIKTRKLSDEEYEKYKLNCLRSSDFDCLNTKDLNDDEYSEYKKECFDEEGNLDCDAIQPKKLSRKQFEQYENKCLERKPSKECIDLNSDEMSDEEYQKYKEKCFEKKNRYDCDSIRPKELTSEEFLKYKKKCLKSPESSMDCENVKINEMNEIEFRRYEEECLEERKPSKDCRNINPNELSVEEFERYERACIPKETDRKPNCDNINPDSLSDEEYSKYKRDCLDSPKTPSNSGCRDINPDELSREEFKKYQRRCLSSNTLPPDCENVNVNELSDDEFSKYKKTCSYSTTPGGNVDITKIVNVTGNGVSPNCLNSEECEKGGRSNTCGNADIDSMTDSEYNAYKRKCNLEFEGNDCEEIRVDKLSDEKLREYVDKCGLFCGIDRKEILSKKQRRLFEERCEGDSNELEKDCKDIVFEKLGEKMYGDFAEKCLEPINACSMLKSVRIVRKVFNEYRRRCKPVLLPSGNSKCENVDTERMTLEEYREYKKNCGKNQKYDCDNMNIDVLSDKEYSEYLRRCEIDREHEDCKDIEVDSLSREEYKKYLKKCGRRPPTETSDEDCDSIDTNEMSQRELLIHARRCQHNPDTVDRICDNVNWKSELELKKLCQQNPSTERTGPPGGNPKNCSSVDIEKMNEEEYEKYRKECSRKPSKSTCKDVNVDELSDEEYRQYVKKCKSPRGGPDYPERPNREGCDSVKIEELSSDEYLAYKKRCLSPRTPGDRTPETPYNTEKDDCSNVDVDSLSSEEYEKYRRNCKMTRKTPDCNIQDASQLSDEEYRIYKKKCGRNPDETPKSPGNPYEPSVTVEKIVEGSDCFSVDIEKLSESEYQEYKRRCKGRKTPKPDCDDIDVNKLSDDEYRDFKRKCESPSDETSNIPGEPSVTITKTVEIEEPPKNGYPRGTSSPGVPRSFDDCSNVNIAKLSDDKYDEYRRICKKIRKGSNPECEDIDEKNLSEDELEEYKRKCSNQPEYIEEVPPSRPSEMDCSDINVEDLDREEFIEYKKRCDFPNSPTKRPPGSPISPNDDCDSVNVEDLTSEEYLDYKKRCLKNNVPRRPGNPDRNCLNVDVNELTDKEYRTFIRRCPQPENVKVEKTVVVNKECQNRNTDEMTREEYENYKRKCLKKPFIQLTKTVKIIDGTPPGEMKREFSCLNADTNQMTDKQFAEYQEKCRGFHQTFQFNCNSDVTNMTDLEFRKFRKACGKKPFDCETADVDSLSKKDLKRFKRECGEVTNCKNAKIEQMSDREYENYKKKCKKSTTKISANPDCDDVRVEELSRKEYDEYKIRCESQRNPEKTDTPPKQIRRRVDCSIVDESMMSEEEYADFKKHCNVKVPTDRYRPGENIILTKKVKIRTGKEKFSCYDQDVDAMSDEEYAEFEKKCLSNPHFRFDCQTVDTSNLSREEYSKYQRECLKTKPSIVLVKKLIVNGTNEVIKDGCYNRNVDIMTDEEYGRYEVKCLGREPTVIPPKTERKSHFDCHNVDLSELSVTELEEYIKRCRTRETASTPSPPRRRQSLKCSDVKTHELDDEAYSKWTKECLTSPKTIQLEKKLIINETTPLMSGGETVVVEKFEIHEHLRPDDDEGYLEGNEGFGVRILTGIRKKVIKGRPDDDSESETGVILVKKVIHKIPGRRRPFDVDNKEDEGGVIEVKKFLMKISQPEPDTDDSEDIEEIMRRPRKKVDPKEEVVLLSVTNKHSHSYRKTIPEEEEPIEVVKLVKNTKHPNATLREVRIRKHFGTGVPGEEAVIHEIGGNDFKITRKTVMIPHKIRKMKPTTTTTTTPAEPEYYYDEEEVPEIITLVKVDKSIRPLRKLSKPEDEDDEHVDVKEDHPKSYIEFEGYVKVRGSPRKLRKRPTFTDSGEEPDIREVTRKVIQGSEEDDFKGVKLKSHRKKLIMIRKVTEEIPEDEEHEVTVVKKLKVLKFGNEEIENFDDDQNVEDDGRIIVKNRRRVVLESGRERPGEDEEEEEHVEGRLAVRGRAPKKFRWIQRSERKESHQPLVTERNSEFYRIGGSEEDDVERKRRRREEEERRKALEEEEEGGIRKRRRPDEYEEDEEEELRRRRKTRYEESEKNEKKRREPTENENVIIKKLYRIDQNGKGVPSRNPKNQREGVVLTKKKVFKYGSDRREIPDDDDENEEIRLLNRKKLLRIDSETERNPLFSDGNGPDRNGEIVKVTKRKFYRIGPNGEKELIDGDDIPKRIRKSSRGQQDSEEELNVFKQKRKLIGTNGNPSNDGEMVKISKKKVYRIGPNGERELVDNDESGGRNGRKIFNSGIESEDIPDDGTEQIIGSDGKRELIREEEFGGGKENSSGGMTNGKKMFGESKSTYSQQPLDDVKEEEDVRMNKDGMESEGDNGHGEKTIDGEQQDGDDQEMITHKKKRFYKIGPDGKRELIRTEGDDFNETGDEKMTKMKKTRRFYKKGKDGKRELIRTEESDANPEDENKIEPNSENSKVNKDDFSSQNDVKPPGKNTKVMINRRGFFKGGRLSVPDESEENDGKNTKNEEQNLMRNQKNGEENDGYEYEMKPRVKRTYVLDGNGKRKLVDEQSGDEKSNLDLGKLLRPKRKITETETVDRKHRETKFEKKGSSRMTKSFSNHGMSGDSMSHEGKMQKYHKDRNLRTGGKSEEDVPDEK
uniref:Uncharacterized protein n=1 Tax=Caenorhabditis tropicalis TaxID=1561998 RepID=A0A1I7UL95_9PELO